MTESHLLEPTPIGAVHQKWLPALPREARSIVDVIGPMAEGYDVVLVDIPGIFSDPLMAPLVQGWDHIVAIVGHGGMLIDVERLRDNLDQPDAVCDGVVFSKVPEQAVARMAGG